MTLTHWSIQYPQKQLLLVRAKLNSRPQLTNSFVGSRKKQFKYFTLCHGQRCFVTKTNAKEAKRVVLLLKQNKSDLVILHRNQNKSNMFQFVKITTKTNYICFSFSGSKIKQNKQHLFFGCSKVCHNSFSFLTMKGKCKIEQKIQIKRKHG